ncbi:MAG: tail fiber domain-containing protein [Limnohabitans sp.]|uniref:tail fiber domain-containing protein n=1 Tax=Limnohabitans sp. TaxID=1907725 RepID=UPI003BB033FF
MKTKRERFEERQQALRELHGHNWRNVCHLDMGGDAPPPPDYTPVAQASKEAAEISAQLGREQMAESRRQYEQNIEIARPIVDAQKRNMDQAYEQGNYSFDNFKTEGRPLQQAMRDIAMGKVSPELQTQMDKAATENVADVSAALDNQRQQTNRSMTRMSVNPNSGRFAAMQGVMDLGAATAKAGAANTGRIQAVDKSYARMGDTLNTYSGMASSAPSFYSAGTNSGNSAVTNQMTPGGAMMAGMNAGASTTMNGRQIAMTGLTGVMNAQANYAKSVADMDSGLGGVGSVLGGAASLYTAFSDRRLKENIVLVGKHRPTGLNLYEFSYINGDGKRFVGVMADEVEPRFPDAVVYDDMGFASVNYQMLGIEFEEVK